MKKRAISVISGDVIGSIQLSRKELNAIQGGIKSLLNSYKLTNYFFQGDSFVCVTPVKEMPMFLTLLRLTTIANKKNPESFVGDLKTSVSVGNLKSLSSLKNIKTAQEEVFVVSGRNLNLLNNAPATEFKTLIIESTQKEDNLLLESIATGLEYVFMQMTPRQAMVNKLAFEGLTQKDIGTQLGVSQQNIQKTLQAGGYKMVLKYQQLLEKSFEVQNLI